MALSDSYTETKGGITCKMCRFYPTLPPADRAFFDEKALESEERDGAKAALHRACVDEGFTGSIAGLKRHLEHHVPS